MTGNPGRQREKFSARATPQLYEEGFELAKAIRGELFSYVGKISIAALVLVVGSVGTAAWAYFEWRLPQIAGGVPKDAVLAFNKPNCPDGWKRLENNDMRAIVVAAPHKEGDQNAHPRPLNFNGTTRHVYGEYRLVKVPNGEQIGENEERVVIPGLLALTFCVKA